MGLICSLCSVSKQNNNNKENKGDGGGGEKKTASVTVVLKIDMHCEGCASKIVKCVRTFQGFDFISFNVTVLFIRWWFKYPLFNWLNCYW